MREQQRIDPAHRHAELVEADRGAASGVDQEFLVAGFDEGRGSETLGARDRHAGSEQGHAEAIRRRHWCILIPESFTTLVQCPIWEPRNCPNSAGVPPAGSAAIFAIASRTRGFASALLTALVQANDDLVRRSRLHQQAEPVLDDQVGETSLADRRHVFQDGQSRRPGDGERAQLAGGDQVDDGKRRDELKVVGSVEQIGDGPRQRVIRHMGGADAGLQLEHFSRRGGPGCRSRRRRTCTCPAGS